MADKESLRCEERHLANGLPIWLVPNVLSLDAPVIAVLWQDFAARSYPSPIRPAGRVVLALTVWAIYLLDRLLDVRQAPTSGESTRHRFYRQHQAAAWILLVFVLAADCATTILWLRPAVLHAGVLLSVLVVTYLLVFHFAGGFRVPKEVAVAVLFAAGTMLVPATWAGQNEAGLLAGGAAFCLLCLANLVAIEVWEFQELRNGVRNAPASMTAWLGQWYLVWVPLLCAGSAVGGSKWFTAVSWSAGTLSLVFALAGRLSLDSRRVFVDAALLSPLLFLR